MRIDEILRIQNQSFSKNQVEKLLSSPNCQRDSDPFEFDPKLSVNYINTGEQVVIILTDAKNNIAAYAGFKIISDKLWQSKNVEVYSPYNGNNLSAKIYKSVKNIGISIQSDIEQSKAGELLWTILMPKVGLSPKIFDTDTNYILDPSVNKQAYDDALKKIYVDDRSDSEKYKYTWILETNDNYPYQNVLRENHLLMPFSGFWHNYTEEKLKYNKGK